MRGLKRTSFRKGLTLGLSGILGGLTCVALFSGCGSWGKRSASESFSQGVRLPEHEELVLNNGLRILFIQDDSLPRISIMALVGSGAIHDPVAQAGRAYLTASLLDEGTDKHTSAELAEKLEGLGASFSIQPGYDFTYLSMRGLSYTRETLFDVFMEVLLGPKFDPKEVNRLKQQIKGALAKIQDDPDSYADRLFAQTIFQEHPYARPAMGTVASMDQISREDLVRYYKETFIPSNTMIAVVGDFDPIFKNRVKNSLGIWMSASPQGSPPVSQPTKVVAGVGPAAKKLSGSRSADTKKDSPPSPAIHVKGKSGLVQAQIRMGHPLIERSHPDFLALRAANMALGGTFASRLNQKVRDDLGLTYGASSSFDARRQPGPFMIETFTRNDKVSETIEATRSVFTQFAEKGLTEDELQACQSVLIGQFPRAVETVDSLAYQMMALRHFDIDYSYLTQFVSNVKGLRLDKVNQVIKKHFHPTNLEVVVYGDAATFEGALQKLGTVQKIGEL